MATKSRSPRRSLSQFVQDKKRENCPVCALPKPLRDEIQQARSRKIQRSIVLAWLKVECALKIASSDLDRHTGGRHDRDE